MIPSTLARVMGERGHNVRVLTGYPNYPTGEVYHGYKQRWRSMENHGGVDVLRVPLWADHSQGPVKRIFNYLSFAFSAATARSFARGADVIYVYATQMTPAFAPWIWRLTGGRIPYVLHVQDLWPDSITGSSLVAGGLVSRAMDTVLGPWLRSVYRHASAVVGIAPTMVKTLVERGVDEGKALLVYNWAAEQGPAEGEASATGPAERGTGARILYAGNVGDMQDLETAVWAAHAARDAEVHLTILGDGIALPRVRELAESLGADNVDFLPRVPREKMGDLYREADFALVTLKDLPVFRGTVPSKLQASLAHGVPVITSVQGDVREIVESLGVGLTADAESVDSLAAAFRAAGSITSEAHAAMATRARDAYQSRFSQSAAIAALERILAEASRQRESAQASRNKRSVPRVVVD